MSRLVKSGVKTGQMRRQNWSHADKCGPAPGPPGRPPHRPPPHTHTPTTLVKAPRANPPFESRLLPRRQQWGRGACPCSASGRAVTRSRARAERPPRWSTTARLFHGGHVAVTSRSRREHVVVTSRSRRGHDGGRDHGTREAPRTACAGKEARAGRYPHEPKSGHTKQAKTGQTLVEHGLNTGQNS